MYKVAATKEKSQRTALLMPGLGACPCHALECLFPLNRVVVRRNWPNAAAAAAIAGRPPRAGHGVLRRLLRERRGTARGGAWEHSLMAGGSDDAAGRGEEVHEVGEGCWVGTDAAGGAGRGTPVSA